MELDKDLIRKLQNTDDETLRGAVKQIAEALGASERQAANAARNIGKFKKQLGKMSDAELKEAIDRVGEDKANEILRQLGKNG